MLIVDGPLQFLVEDNGKDAFADLFYNVVGVSKSFDPNFSISDKRNGTHIWCINSKVELWRMNASFPKEKFAWESICFWVLKNRRRESVRNPVDGIIKVEMALREDIDHGFDTDVIDNISLLAEGIPTCHGKDERWPNHLYQGTKESQVI
jgi:hypothetical protein